MGHEPPNLDSFLYPTTYRDAETRLIPSPMKHKSQQTQSPKKQKPLIYDLDEEVPPNVPDCRKTSRKEKSVVQTRSSSMELKRPPQDSVARKPSSKDQILRKKQKTEYTVLSSWKDKKPKSKKHKRKNTNQKRKREARGNTKPIQNGRGVDLRKRNKKVPQKENQKTPPRIRR
jgi:hypothetical protein